MEVVRSNGLDFEGVNLDVLGIFYICIAVVYTGIVGAGLWYFWSMREHEAIRIRGVFITMAAVASLHVYLVLVLLVYPWNGLFKCGAEFWIMSIFLPFGMALFQASNVQVLSRYEAQLRLIKANQIGRRKERFSMSRRGVAACFSQLNTAQKTYIGITFGLIATIVTTVVLFFGSRMFHNSYGFFGTHVNAIKCRRGVEWIPSIFWQILWTAVFGPYVLWRIRRIRDARYWALQTRLAIFTGIFGTPLWLAFVYAESPGIAAINKWFAPAGWFLPSLVTIQGTLIIIPLIDARRPVKPRSLGRSRSRTGSQETFVSPLAQQEAESRRSRDPYSMSALEERIEGNIEPLIEWAAMKEFTAENIVFLKEVRDWRRKWTVDANRQLPLTDAQRRQMFHEAALIWFALVEKSTAEFNINIDHRTYARLAGWFNHLSYRPYADSSAAENVITPWDDFNADLDVIKDDVHVGVRGVGADNFPMRGAVLMSPVRASVHLDTASVTSSTASPNLQVPNEFTTHVFDGAFQSVKYLVLTNTWVRFTDRSETSSFTSDWSDDTVVGQKALAQDSKSLA